VRNRQLLRLAAWALAGAIFSCSSAHAASKSAGLTLPILVDQTGIEAGSATVNAGQLFGVQSAHFRSFAHVTSSVRIPQKKTELLISPTDSFVEYTAHLDGATFPIYCTARPAKPVWTLTCLADRDGNDSFEQLWSGTVANPRVWVPFPNIRYQSDIEPVEYNRSDGMTTEPLSIGFVGFGGNIWTGQREFFVQLEKGDDHVVLFESRVTGSAKKGPVDLNLYDARVRFEGGTREQLQVTVTKGLTAGRYQLSLGYPERQIWVYVP